MKEYNLMLDIIKEAGEMLIPYYENGVETRIKGGDIRNYVTKADIEVNDFIINKIKSKFPNHNIHSEEGNNGQGKKEGQPTWMIDPIDGTSNFSRQIPYFSVCIGFVDNEEILFGGVYNPITKELFTFKKGEGAFKNNLPIQLSKTEDLNRCFVFMRTGGGEAELQKWGVGVYSNLLKKANKTYSLGASALDICYLASGRIESVIYGKLTLSDIVSAVGILKEVGGIICDKEGNDIVVNNEQQTVIFANNDKVKKQIIEEII